MKNLLSILLLFVSAALLGQADTIPVDNSIDGGYGVSVFSGKPGVSWPGDTSRYTQIAYDKVRNILWGYDRNSESNVMLARELAFLADIGDTTTIGSSYNGMLAWAEDVQALYVRKQTGWELLSAGGGGSVTSVNAQTGVVVLDADDIDDSATTNKFTTAGDISKLAGIESGATANQTANEIKDSLETLTGVNRLDAAYIQNLAPTHSTLSIGSPAFSVDAGYWGAAPSLTNPSTGTYTITVPTGTKMIGVTLRGNSTNHTSSSTLTVNIVDTDGRSIHGTIYACREDGTFIPLFGTGVIPKQDPSVSGTVTYTFLNMGYPSGFRITITFI